MTTRVLVGRVRLEEQAAAAPCCDHCLHRLGFGLRLRRVLLYLVHHVHELEGHELTGTLEFHFGRVGNVRARFVEPPVEISLG